MRQLGPPELPGTVEMLPTDVVAWATLSMSALLLFGWWVAWWRRKQALGEQNASTAVRAITRPPMSPHDALQELRDSLDALSPEQRQEAARLSFLLRDAGGRRWSHDFRSATDEDLLAEIAEYDPSGPPLAPLLGFASIILYAGRRPDHAAWEKVLDEVAVWLQAAVEEKVP